MLSSNSVVAFNCVVNASNYDFSNEENWTQQQQQHASAVGAVVSPPRPMLSTLPVHVLLIADVQRSYFDKKIYFFFVCRKCQCLVPLWRFFFYTCNAHPTISFCLRSSLFFTLNLFRFFDTPSFFCTLLSEDFCIKKNSVNFLSIHTRTTHNKDNNNFSFFFFFVFLVSRTVSRFVCENALLVYVRMPKSKTQRTTTKTRINRTYKSC